jgi:hypothetical protein
LHSRKEEEYTCQKQWPLIQRRPGRFGYERDPVEIGMCWYRPVIDLAKYICRKKVPPYCLDGLRSRRIRFESIPSRVRCTISNVELGYS